MTIPDGRVRRELPETIPCLAEHAAKKWPDEVAVSFDLTGEELTFREVHERSNAIAKVLIELGTEPGDRVAVMLQNRAEFPLAWLGITKARAVMVPINTFAQMSDARYLLEHSGARTILTEADYVDLLQSVQPGVPDLTDVVLLQTSDAQEGSIERLGSLNVTSFPVHFEADPPLGEYWGEDLTNIQYTSGTTGFPKGCMLSNQYWIQLSRLYAERPPEIAFDDVLLTAQPFSYIDAQWNILVAMHVGARLVVLDRFHPSTFWAKVSEYGVTFFYCLGAMPALMNKMPPSRYDRDHSVRYIECSAIPVHLHETLEARYGAPWYELFGATETGADLTMTVDEREDFVGTGCIGRPFAHREARIVDEDDTPVRRGEKGQLVLRGHSMMDGYFRDPESTAKAFRNGWYHTGDIAWMDSEGRVFYHGRSKDIIRRSGENVSAVEVETVLSRHPAVGLCACLPVADEIRGEEIKAFIVLESEAAADVEELIQYCKRELAYYKVPRYWEFRDSLPLTVSQKVAKAELRIAESVTPGKTYDTLLHCWV